MARALKLSEAQAREILRHYDLGSVERLAWLASGYQSDNYTLLTDRGKYCLRIIYEKEQRLEYVLGLYAFLADQGIPTARPISTVEGRLYVLHGGTPAAIQAFVEGVSAADDPKPLSVYGQVLGRLHAALAAAPLEGLKGQGKGCLSSLRMFSEWFPPDPWLRGQYEAVERELASLPLSTYTRCVVH
ncbi:MAG: phosphotransferase, partial [Dehalococcoidia bacterium]